MPNSRTANLIYTLAKGQEVMDEDFCKVWKYWDANMNKEGLNNDFSLAGELIAYDYIKEYKGYCN